MDIPHVPLPPDEFSILVSVLIAVFAMGIVTLVVGPCLLMPRLGHHWWEGLIPGYNFYVLFCEARCQVLLALYLIVAALCYEFWASPFPEIQELVWWPVFIGVFMICWLSLCIAQRMHLSLGWQLLALVLPTYAWCLMGLLPVQLDRDAYPWAIHPFLHVEHWLWRHPWEYERHPSPPEEVPPDLFGDEDFEFFGDGPLYGGGARGDGFYGDVGEADGELEGTAFEGTAFGGYAPAYEGDGEPYGDDGYYDEFAGDGEFAGEDGSLDDDEGYGYDDEVGYDDGWGYDDDRLDGDDVAAGEPFGGYDHGGEEADAHAGDGAAWPGVDEGATRVLPRGGVRGSVLGRQNIEGYLHHEELMSSDWDYVSIDEPALDGGSEPDGAAGENDPTRTLRNPFAMPSWILREASFREALDGVVADGEGQRVEPVENGNNPARTPDEGPAMRKHHHREPEPAPQTTPDDDRSPATSAEDVPVEDRYEAEAPYRGRDFDPVGDEAVEERDEREPSAFSRHVERILDEEAELFDRHPRAAEVGSRPDDDLSDLVEGQIEGIYAEQLGYPGVTQDVDAEEAAYLEENAAYARERVLEATHDEPDGQGYVARHLASSVRRAEQEGADEGAMAPAEPPAETAPGDDSATGPAEGAAPADPGPRDRGDAPSRRFSDLD